MVTSLQRLSRSLQTTLRVKLMAVVAGLVVVPVAVQWYVDCGVITLRLRLSAGLRPSRPGPHRGLPQQPPLPWSTNNTNNTNNNNPGLHYTLSVLSPLHLSSVSSQKICPNSGLLTMFDIVDLCSLMPSVSSAMQSVMIAVNLPKPVPASDTAGWDTSVAHWTQSAQQSNNAIILF